MRQQRKVMERTKGSEENCDGSDQNKPIAVDSKGPTSDSETEIPQNVPSGNCNFYFSNYQFITFVLMSE